MTQSISFCFLPLPTFFMGLILFFMTGFSGLAAGLSQGLVAYYPLDGNASDFSGNEKHGDANGTALGTDRHGRLNRAFDFDGNTSSIILPFGSDFNTSKDSFTVSLWAYLRDNNNSTLFEQGTEYNRGRDLINVYNGEIGSRVGGAFIGGTHFEKLKWKHLVLAYKVVATRAVRRLYLDGKLIHSDNNETPEDSSQNFIVGRDVQTKDFMDGLVDDIRIYSRFLSAGQAKALYDFEKKLPDANATLSGTVSFVGPYYGPALVGAYDLNGTMVANTKLLTGEGDYSLIVPDGRSYNLSAYIDVDANEKLNYYIEPVKIFGEWNATRKKYNPLAVDGSRSDLNFNLQRLDTDGDGYDNIQEYRAESNMSDANSSPGLNFGRIGWWKLLETNRTIAQNFVQPLGNHGEYKTEHNSTEIYIEVPHRNQQSSEEGTVAFWAKLNGSGGAEKQGFFSKDAQGMGSGGHLSIYEQNGTLTTRLQSKNKSYTLDANESVVRGQWIHIAFMWGHTGMKLFLDGNLVGSDPYQGGLGINSGGTGNQESIILGAGSWKRQAGKSEGIEGYLKGRLYDVILYDRKIKNSEIGQLINRLALFTNKDSSDDRGDQNHTDADSNNTDGAVQNLNTEEKNKEGDVIVEKDSNGSFAYVDQSRKVVDFIDSTGSDQNYSKIENINSLYVPIVRTDVAEVDENGSYIFSGKVLADGGALVKSVGILISRDIFFTKSTRLNAEVNRKSKKFSIGFTDFRGGETYYYRAYGRNSVGENQGVRRKLKIPLEKIHDKWKKNAVSVGAGWMNLKWFGNFRVYENIDWIYHSKLGWIFTVTDQNDGVWLWQKEWGWMWTQRGVWPYLFNNRKGAWFYFIKNDRGKPIFFDYAKAAFLRGQKDI